MKKAAIAQAGNRIDKAKRSIAEFKSAKRFDIAASAWSDFLIAASGVYSKLEQGAKGAGKSEAWFGRKKHERKNDQLLRYLHHARNADEHGIEPTTANRRSFEVRGGGSYRFDGTFGSHTDMTITHQDGPPPIIEFGTKIVLAPVTDTRFGDRFEPPTEHLGAPIPEPDPEIVAALALSYLEGLISEAAELTE